MKYIDGEYGIVIFTKTDEDFPDKVIVTVGTTQNVSCIKAGAPQTKPCGDVLKGFTFFYSGTDGSLWTAEKLVDKYNAQAVFNELVKARQNGTLTLKEDH